MYITNPYEQDRWVVEPKQWNKQTFIGIFIVLMFLINGFIGIGFSAYAKLFISCTPLYLLAAAAAIIWAQSRRNNQFWLFLAGCGIAGWLVECIGVNTGFPFGDYHYHDGLGAEIAEIPLIMGVMWWLTSFAASAVACELVESRYSRMLFAALLMVVFDVPVEHIAGKLGMWHWEAGYAPFQNYLGWFVYGFILQYFLQTMNFEKKNKVAVIYFIAAFLFFAALDVIEW